MAEGFVDGYYWIGRGSARDEFFIAWVAASRVTGALGWRLDRWEGDLSPLGPHLDVVDSLAGPILPGAHIPANGPGEAPPVPEVVPALMAPFGPGVCIMGSDGGLWTIFPGDKDFTPLPELPARRTP